MKNIARYGMAILGIIAGVEVAGEASLVKQLVFGTIGGIAGRAVGNGISRRV